MTGKHRLIARRHHSWISTRRLRGSTRRLRGSTRRLRGYGAGAPVTDNPRRRILITAALSVCTLSIVIGVAGSGVTVGDAAAAPPAQIHPVPNMPIPAPAPRDADEQRELSAGGANEKFLTGLASAGIATAGREDALMTIAKRGAQSHTTDADLEQSVRALFPDIDQIRSEKFVYQVRQNWPGDHGLDSDGDGR